MSILNIREPDGSVVKLECHEALPSTLKLARIYARANYPDRYVVFSERKLPPDGKGEGTLGVYMSCILRPSFFPSQATFLGALATVAAAQALEEHTTEPLSIGWISSVYCGEELIGSISIEGKLNSYTAYEYIIVNFSLALSKESFPPRLTDLIKKVFEKDSNSVPMIIAKNILSKFFPLYSNMKNTAKFMDSYRQKFILRGKKVRFNLDGKRAKLKVLTFDEQDCSLLVEGTDGMPIKISSPKSIILPKKIKIKKREEKVNLDDSDNSGR